MNQRHNLLQPLIGIIKLSSPMMLNQLINMASQFLCVGMVAHYGTTALASTALAFGIQIPAMMTTMALLSITGVLISSAHAKCNFQQVDRYLQQGWLISLIFASLIIILFANTQYILLYFGYSQNIIAYVQRYFAAYNTGVLFILLSSCNTQYGNSTAKPLTVFTIGCFSVLVLLVTAYFFILNLKLQLSGLGYAIACQGCFYFITTTLVLRKTKLWLSLFTCRLNDIYRILTLGLPVSLQLGIELIGFFILTQIVAILGLEALASYQIINQYLLIATIPIIAFSQACAITCAKSSVNHKNVAVSSSLFLFALTILNAILSSTYAPFLISFFHDPYYIINNNIQLAAIFIIFDSIKNMFIGLLRGITDTRFSMLSSLVSTFLLTVPLSYILAVKYALGLNGILIAAIISSSFNIIALNARWWFLLKSNDQTGVIYAY